MKMTNLSENNGYPQLIKDCNAPMIKEILERVLHSITGKFDRAGDSISSGQAEIYFTRQR